MEEEYYINWWDDSYHLDRKRKEEDTKHQIVNEFLIHLKNLISTSSSKKDRIQISLDELYKDFEYPQIAKKIFLNHEKKNFSEIEKAHYLTRLADKIKINENVRPYEYILIEDKTSNDFKLRPYQNYIIEDTINAKGSVLIEAPTGSGKSVIACEIAKKEIENGGKILIVAPKIILLEQLKETFETLLPQIIHGAKDYDETHNVFISTIQTAHKRDLGFEPTMILLDEVHYGFSVKMIKTLLEDFKGILVGLSATPYDEKGEKLEGFDLHISDYNLTYMIQNKYLHHPKCFATLKVDLSKIGILAADYNQTDLDKEFNNIQNISKLVESTKDIIKERKASLVFCINIVHSEAVAKAFCDAGIITKAIHSKLSKEEQKNILNDYKIGKIKMLANPVMLTTEFDHPITDTIILARPTQSQNLYRQMVGRALRLAQNKEDAIILDCSSTINRLGLPTETLIPVSTFVVSGLTTLYNNIA